VAIGDLLLIDPMELYVCAARTTIPFASSPPGSWQSPPRGVLYLKLDSCSQFPGIALPIKGGLDVVYAVHAAEVAEKVAPLHVADSGPGELHPRVGESFRFSEFKNQGLLHVV
jgi:hypothetical protein